MENATVEVTVQGVASSLDEITGGTITIYTTDFEITGTVELSGGVINWGEIEDNIPGIKIINIPDSVGKNEEKTLSIKRKHVSESAPVTWTSQTTSIATIGENTGVVRGVELGTSKITASVADGETTYTAECTIKVELSKADKINAKIGEVIAYDGYNTTKYDGTWKIFYADSEEMFIISSEIIPSSIVGLDTNGIPIDQSMVAEAMGENTYGAKWNKNWLTKSGAMKNENRHKAAAYLCDKSKWPDFKTSTIAKVYAVGGPTCELFIASWNKAKQDSKTVWTDAYGYGAAISNGITTSEVGGLYNKPTNIGYYFLASPYCQSDNSNKILCFHFYIGGLFGNEYNSTSYEGVRPLVSIPLSNVLVDNSGNVSIKRDDGTIMVAE